MKRLVSFAVMLCVLVQLIPKTQALEINAKAAVVINAATGEIVYTQNGDQKLPMASTTKIMTALLLCEMADLNETIVTTKEMVTVEGSSMGLLPGDTVSYKALLYGMLLPSGNDAATTAAIALGGSSEEFSLLMNKKAKELSMDNTNFVTPSGLDAENHYSTASDLAKLTAYALKNPTFREAVATKSITVEYGNPAYSRRLYGHNKMLDIYEGAIGVKTGYTSKSGKCLVSAAERNGVEIVAVTLGDSNTWGHHKTLLDYGFSRVNSVTFSCPKAAETLHVISGNKTECKLTAPSFTIGLTPEEQERVEYKISLPDFRYAPINSGEQVGFVSYHLNGKLLKSVPLKAETSVNGIAPRKLSFWGRFQKNLKYIFKN